MDWPWRQGHRGISLRLPKRLARCWAINNEDLQSYADNRSGLRHKTKALMFPSGLCNVAVREGFEPSIRCRIHTFQACSFSHSDTSPNFGLWFNVFSQHGVRCAVALERGVI